MKEYEIVITYLNGCAGDAYPQISFDEAELNDPADYVRKKHGKDFEKIHPGRPARRQGALPVRQCPLLALRIQ